MFRISEKLKSFEGIDDQFFSEVVDDLSSRAKKLEDDLLRYETSFAINELISTLSVTMESQLFVTRMWQTQFQVYKLSLSYTHARRSEAYSTPTGFI
jgi:hypothetical protein